MINFHLNIRNPFSDRFANVKDLNGSFSKHKHWEFQVYKSNDILELFVRYTIRQSHAGIHLGLGLFGYNIEFQIYDSRHWDSKTHKWEV